MNNLLEIKTAVELFSETCDLATDWLIKSWDLKDEDKTIALAYYSKACKERSKLVRRLEELCQ